MKTHCFLGCLVGLIALTTIANAESFHGKDPSVDQVKAALGLSNSPNKAHKATDIPSKKETKQINNSESEDTRSLVPESFFDKKKKQLSEEPQKPTTHKKRTPIKKLTTNEKPLEYQKENNAVDTDMIVFERGSSQLTDEAKKHIAPYGLALASSEAQNQVFVIEGHTDAVGSDDDNLRLSEKRAEAVKRYLHEMYEVDSSHLQIVPKGESEPFDPHNPNGKGNRRVVIIKK